VSEERERYSIAPYRNKLEVQDHEEKCSVAIFWSHEEAEAFVSLQKRLAQAEQLAEALQSLIVQIDKANFMDELGHPLRMNVAYFSAKDALTARGRQSKEK